jgi:hypothetical protein
LLPQPDTPSAEPVTNWNSEVRDISDLYDFISEFEGNIGMWDTTAPEEQIFDLTWPYAFPPIIFSLSLSLSLRLFTHMLFSGAHIVVPDPPS